VSKAIAIVSGGLDSVTLAHYLHTEGYELHLLSFDYGQRHDKELQFAERCAQRLSVKHTVIDITSLGQLLRGSALTDDQVEVPDGHYADSNMSVTVVPNRNAVMLAVGFSVAAAEGAEVVALGVHGGDHFIYPDCRPEFIQRFDHMEQAALGEFAQVRLYAPFLDEGKDGIVRIGSQIGVPFEETWSCYKGDENHCGTCGTCVERKEAFQKAGIKDPTIYKG
jgi:7-cyano-7-deazaguanine synthase